MKKIFLIIFFLSSNIQAGPFFSFEAGPALNVENISFVECVIGYKIKFWKIQSKTYGGWLTWYRTDNQNIFTNKPFMDIYSINQKFIYKNFFVQYKHYCSHPVINGENNYPGANPDPYWWNGTIHTASFGFEFEIK